MAKIVAIFAILLGAISASELWKDEIEKKVNKWTTLKEMDCNYLRGSTYQFFELDSIVDARPAGYKAKIPFSVVGEKEAWIILSKDANSSTGYSIALGWDYANTTILRRHIGGQTHTVKEDVRRGGISLAVPSDVVFAVTIDGVVTATVEGETIINYHDPKPIEIHYLGFGVYKSDVQFYFNCTIADSDDLMDIVTTRTNIRHVNSSDRLLCTLTTTISLIVFHFVIACINSLT